MSNPCNAQMLLKLHLTTVKLGPYTIQQAAD